MENSTPCMYVREWQALAEGVPVGYSNSRTCEIGLVNEHTVPATP